MTKPRTSVTTGPQQELFTIKLTAKVHNANATAVAATMDAVVAILREAERQINPPDKLLIKARAFASGSFEIPLDLIFVGTALTVGMPYVDELLRIFKGYLSLKKLLKGNPAPDSAKDGAFVLDGNTINISESVVNVYNNSPVNEAVSRAATEIEGDENISAMVFLKGVEQEQIGIVPRAELTYLQIPDTTLDLEPNKNVRKKRKVTLVVRKPVLCDSKDKWSFLYVDRPIMADILDEGWLRKVTASIERFGSGDRLIVDLSIHDEWNPALQAFEAKRYSVVKIHDHKLATPERQLTIFDKPKKQSIKRAKKRGPAKPSKKAKGIKDKPKKGGKKKGS